MTAFQLLPVVLSLLVLGAHFFRSGWLSIVVVILLLLATLALRRPWVARVVQAALWLGALEWVRTLVVLVDERTAAGEPVVRLSVILGGVALVTGLSPLVFRTGRLRRRYRISP